MYTAIRRMKLMGIVLALSLIFGVAYVWAGEFSADLFQKEQLNENSGRIYVKDGLYRMDLKKPAGPDVVVIVDQGANKTRVLVPRYKLYMEMASDHPMSQMNDPFQSVKAMLKRYSIREDGTEKVLGYECARQIIHYKETDIMGLWKAQKLDFTIKLKAIGRDDIFTELRNIREAPVKADMFKIPEGYKSASGEEIEKKTESDPAMKAKYKEYKKNRPRKDDVNSPMEAGSIFHVLPGPHAKVTIEVSKSGPSGQALEWYAALLKDGRPVGDTPILRFQEAKKVALDKELGADEIVMGIIKGEGWGKVKLEGRPPLMLGTYQEYYIKSHSGKSWTVKPYEKMVVEITCDPEEGSKKKPGWMRLTLGKGSRDKPKRESSKIKLDPGKSVKYEFSPDDKLVEMGLTVDAGRFRVKVIHDRRPTEKQKPFSEFRFEVPAE